MKSVYLFVFSVFLGSFGGWASAASDLREPDPRNLRLASASALVVEAGAPSPLYEKKAEIPTPIASLTKLMTAMVVLDSGLPLDEVLDVSVDDLDYIKGTHSRLATGARLTRGEMLQLALMSSENRAAAALARHYPGGRLAFIVEMNVKAHALNLQNTSFADSTGLSPENVSTAQDLAVIVQTAARYPLIRQYTTTPERTVEVTPAGRTLGYQNSNRLVRAEDGEWDILLQKTGYINEAGRCLVMLVKIAQKEFVIVLLDSVGKYTRLGDAQRVKSWIETGKGGDLPKMMAVTDSSKAKSNNKKQTQKKTTPIKKTSAAKQKKDAKPVKKATKKTSKKA